MNNMNLLSIKEFASKLKVSPMTIYRAIKYGRVHAFRVGTGKKASYRINESELERMMVFDLTEIIETRIKENDEKKKSS